MPEWGTFGTALQHFWDVPRAEKVAGGGGGGLAPVLAWPWEEQAPRAFRSHWLFIGNLNESEEEEEEEDNDSDGDEEGENEEEEDLEAGSEKEEEAQLTALEEQRIEGKVWGAHRGVAGRQQPTGRLGASPGPGGQEPGHWQGPLVWGPAPTAPHVPRSPRWWRAP